MTYKLKYRGYRLKMLSRHYVRQRSIFRLPRYLGQQCGDGDEGLGEYSRRWDCLFNITCEHDQKALQAHECSSRFQPQVLIIFCSKMVKNRFHVPLFGEKSTIIRGHCNMATGSRHAGFYILDTFGNRVFQHTDSPNTSNNSVIVNGFNDIYGHFNPLKSDSSVKYWNRSTKKYLSQCIQSGNGEKVIRLESQSIENGGDLRICTV